MGEENVQMTLDFLEPSAIELKVDPFMRVKLYNSATQETHEDIEFKMMFPLSKEARGRFSCFLFFLRGSAGTVLMLPFQKLI